MAAPPDLRTQLRSLSISKDQRPIVDESKVTAPRLPIRMSWVIGGGLVLVLVLVTYFSRGKIESITTAVASASADEIKLVGVTVRQSNEMPPLLTATGKIVSDHQVKVSTKVSGQVLALLFEQGDRVQKGQLLAKVEDVIYRARRDQAAADLEKARANFEYQKINYERMVRLHNTENAPDIEFADAKRSIEEGKAQVAAAQAMVDFSQKSLSDCDVTAPIAGVILERNVEVGDFVAAEGGRGANANAQFGSIADMTTLRVEVDVSELDINRIRKDLPCMVIPDAYKDRRYQGRVMWLDPGANYSKATVQVKVRIENPDDYLRVEGSAQVVFRSADMATSQATDAKPTLWIPLSACLIEAQTQSSKCFIAMGGRLKETPITLGRRSGSEVEVTTGLSPGQMLAAEGLDKLRNGQRIKGGPPAAM
ncbi:MAG: efflux RND transporter periplasmic adaptor subunit [Planctomycetota bacterium]